MVSCLRKRKHLDNIVCGKSAFRAAKIPKLEGKIGRKLKPANSHIQRFSKNLPDDTIGSMLLLSDESTSLCSSTTGPKNKLPGRISPVALPGCAIDSLKRTKFFGYQVSTFRKRAQNVDMI